MAEIVALLQPSAPRSKLVSGAGKWAVHRSEEGQPFYCVVIEGTCRLAAEGKEPLTLEAGDFVLIPAAFDFKVSSLDPPQEGSTAAHTKLLNGDFRHGDPEAPADVRLLVGHCIFASPNAELLVSLLPDLVHVRGEPRFSVLVELVRDESVEQRSPREFVVSRLLEILFVEALRSVETSAAAPGLLRGLVDERLGGALRQMHEKPSEAWTVADLAKEAGLSRSSFFERFSRTVGTAPMDYLLRWRMALAKDLLRRGAVTVAQVAQRVGYRSSSTFSVAFARHVGLPPTQFARERR